MVRLVVRVSVSLVIAVMLAVAASVVFVAIGWKAEAHLDGTLAAMPVNAPVTILRDVRGIPHVRARSIHDLMVAQGYLEAADRLFQIDLVRHHVYGTIAEWFGSAALEHDIHAREYDPLRAVDAEYAALSSGERAMLDAFSAGVNAAIEREPLPVEYRLLFIRPQRWRSQDALAVGFATILDLTDPWRDVIERDRVFRRFGQRGLDALYPITDPRYDVPITGGPPATVAPLPALPPRIRPAHPITPPENSREGKGSNDWAAGAARTRSGRALVANDPHLAVTIPGIWYLIDLEAPNFHVAGATLAGTPGVILGHNERIAWGATNGTVVSESVYVAGAPTASRREVFHVRFGSTVERTYESDRHGFIIADELEPGRRYAIDWEPAHVPKTPLVAFLRLDTASSMEDAVRALKDYPGPPQNFVLGDSGGRVAFYLAGDIPQDPYWGLRVHPASDPAYRPTPFAQLPSVAPRRSALVFTANNRTYGRDYRLRLSPSFSPPYRAAEIASHLRERRSYDVDDFVAMQKETYSIPELELARATLAAAKRRRAEGDPKVASLIADLQGWDGRFDPGSRDATAALALRLAAIGRFTAGFFGAAETRAYGSSASGQFAVVLRALRERPRGYVANDDYDRFLVDALRDAAAGPRARSERDPWKIAGAVRIEHPLAGLGIHWFDGVRLPGDGDAYAIHVQKSNGSQSFRAVWDVGNWDRGGIVIPSGESGRPGSAHYTDLSQTWIAQQMVPLPFGDAAVDATARHHLTLVP